MSSDPIFARDPLAVRRAGVLLHPTSLPGPGAAGGLGDDAWRFVDFLCDGGFTVWQTLPLGPVDSHGSPYCARSSYAGEPRLIDTRRLAALGDLPRAMSFDAVGTSPLEAYASFCGAASERERRRFAAFYARRRRPLFRFALYGLCREAGGGTPWWQWPAPLRNRDPAALRRLLARKRTLFRALIFEQYAFHLLWSSLKAYANARGVLLCGDLPFYMDLDSVDVWWERELFRLDADGKPLAVAGVPPDYFNEEGQLWGNPLYDWEAMRAKGYDWWIRRFESQLERFDMLRIDHFRALDSYWEIPAGAETAREGHWRRGYGAELLARLQQRLGRVPLVAEDLGIITDDVRALRDRFGLPGMAVLQFAFDGKDDNPHLPRNQRRNEVVYTGTHDNDTTVGWYLEQDERTKRRVAEQLGLDAVRVPDDLVEAAYASPAALAVIPMQDLMALGSAARMNTPGSAGGNWGWRFRWDEVDAGIAPTAWERAERHGRLARRDTESMRS
ncbi:MAG TPA: 4-alpha-glucanotransferase [Gammaproteobacteria bacterium]|nr:4-alpha-glucanotransferase [Gammaproteobacteria bacterium]